MTRTTDNRREDSSGSIVTGETGLAHTRTRYELVSLYIKDYFSTALCFVPGP